MYNVNWCDISARNRSLRFGRVNKCTVYGICMSGFVVDYVSALPGITWLWFTKGLTCPVTSKLIN